MNIVAITGVVIAASFIGTLVGFGTNTILEPLLVALISEPVSVLLSAIIHASAGLAKVVLFYRNIDKKLLLGFGLPAVVSTALGAATLLSLPFASMPQYLGWFLLAYVFLVLLNPKISYKPTMAMALFGGIITGFLAGLFGIRGAIQAAFLSTYNLPLDRFIATSGAIALFVDVVRLIVYVIGGLRLATDQTFGLLFFIPASFLGVRLALSVVPYIDQELSKKIVAGALIVFALYLILTGGRSA